MFEIFARCKDFQATPVFFILVASIRAPQRFSQTEATKTLRAPGPPASLASAASVCSRFVFDLVFLRVSVTLW